MVLATELFDEGMEVKLADGLHIEDAEKIIKRHGQPPYIVVEVCPEQDTVDVLTGNDEVIMFDAALLVPFWN